MTMYVPGDSWPVPDPEMTPALVDEAFAEPTPPPDETTVDPDLVEVVALRVASDRARRWGYHLSLGDGLDRYVRSLATGENLRADLASILAALAEHGALMPTGGETREEWCVTYRAGNGVQALWTLVLDTREQAEKLAVQGREEHAESGRWPNLLVERRTITTWPEGHPLAGQTLTSPWRPTDG